MRTLFTFAIAVTITHCTPNNTASNQQKDSPTIEGFKNMATDFDFPKFDWLIGNWERTNDKPGEKTYENWTQQNDSTYLAHGFTLKGTDTIWQEKVVLAPVSREWIFNVIVPSTNEQVPFKLTKSSTESFTCENEDNDFPKIITYKKTANGMEAEISNDEMKVPFTFIKKAP